MPATRPRRIVTETDGVEKALDEAARRWPGLSRAQLLVRLALRGAEAGRREASRRRKARRDVIAGTSGVLTGPYGSGYLEQLRSEWPE